MSDPAPERVPSDSRNVPRMRLKDEAIEEMEVRRTEIEEVRDMVEQLRPVGKSSGWSSVAASLLSLAVGAGITAWVEAAAITPDDVKVGVYLTAAIAALIGAGLAWLGHLSVSKRVSGDVDMIRKKLNRILDSYESTITQQRQQVAPNLHRTEDLDESA